MSAKRNFRRQLNKYSKRRVTLTMTPEDWKALDVVRTHLGLGTPEETYKHLALSMVLALELDKKTPKEEIPSDGQQTETGVGDT